MREYVWLTSNVYCKIFEARTTSTMFYTILQYQSSVGNNKHKKLLQRADFFSISEKNWTCVLFLKRAAEEESLRTMFIFNINGSYWGNPSYNAVPIF